MIQRLYYNSHGDLSTVEQWKRCTVDVLTHRCTVDVLTHSATELSTELGEGDVAGYSEGIVHDGLLLLLQMQAQDCGCCVSSKVASLSSDQLRDEAVKSLQVRSFMILT